MTVHVHRDVHRFNIEDQYFEPSKSQQKALDEGARTWSISVPLELENKILKAIPQASRREDGVPMSHEENLVYEDSKVTTASETGKLLQGLSQLVQQQATGQLTGA